MQSELLSAKAINVASVHRKSFSDVAAGTESVAPTGHEKVHPGDRELQDFDLRDALAGMTVRETSFKEFLAALKKFGPHGQ